MTFCKKPQTTIPMNLTRITKDTYLNLDTVATIKLNGFKPGSHHIITKNRTVAITTSGGTALEFKADVADEVVRLLGEGAGITLTVE